MASYEHNEKNPLSIEVKYRPKPQYEDEEEEEIKDDDNNEDQKVEDRKPSIEQNDIQIEEKNKSHLSHKNKEDDQYTKYDAENKALSVDNIQLSSDNSILNQKLEKLRATVIDIKKRLEKDISKQLEQRKKTCIEQTQILEESNNTINHMKQSIIKKNRLQEDITVFRDRIEQVLKEQFDIETLLKSQEEDIHRFTEQTNKINDIMKLKDKEFGQYEQGCQQLETILSEDHNMINSLREMIKRKEADEKKQNELIMQKESEIQLLQEIINSTQTQKMMTHHNEQNLLKQIQKAKEENKQLNSIIHSTTQKKIDENIIDINNTDNHLILNDIEEENFKELDELMKKVLNE